MYESAGSRFGDWFNYEKHRSIIHNIRMKLEKQNKRMSIFTEEMEHQYCCQELIRNGVVDGNGYPFAGLQ